MVQVDSPAQLSVCHVRASRIKLWFRLFKNQLGNLLIRSGVWEPLFKVRISAPMGQFIKNYQPEIIYCSGYSLAFATLPLMISSKYSIPICFQTLEDWPSYSYRYSPIGALFRRKAKLLISNAALRLAFGEKMQRLYQKRYHVPFEVTYHSDDMKRFSNITLKRVQNVRKIVFSGNLVLSRHECIEDLLKAIRQIENGKEKILIEIYCAGLPKEVPETVRSAPEIVFKPIPAHNELPQILRNADILFLPEAFSVGAARLGLATSTKCHLYMMAECPILAYGPSYAGTMEYAIKHGWAFVVQQRDIHMLADGIRKLLNDQVLVTELKNKALECFKRNHDRNTAQTRFEQMIAAAAANRTGKAFAYGGMEIGDNT